MTKSNSASTQRPKRARSAYNFFFRSERAKLLGLTEDELCVRDRQKRKHRKTPGMMGFAKLAVYIGEKWKSMTDDERFPFRLKSQLDKEMIHRTRDMCSNAMLFLKKDRNFKYLNESRKTDAARLIYQSKLKYSSIQALNPRSIYLSQNIRVPNCNIDFHVTDALEPTPIETMVETSRTKVVSDLSDFFEVCNRQDWLICLQGCYKKMPSTFEQKNFSF